MKSTQLALCLAPLLLTGCVIGNRGTVQVTRNITWGQELTDLKLALDNGSITLSEYQALRARVFESAQPIPGSDTWGGMVTFEEGHHGVREGDAADAGSEAEEH